MPTAVTLVTKHVSINTLLCSWCHTCVEDDKHVLFDCSFALELWESVGLRHLITTQMHDSVIQILQQVFRSGTKEQLVMVGLVCWNLWNRRNCWVWDRLNTSVFGVKGRTYNMLEDWKKASEERSKNLKQQQPGRVRWCKPPKGWIKINTDAACISCRSQAGVGCVVRDDWGRFLRGQECYRIRTDAAKRSRGN